VNKTVSRVLVITLTVLIALSLVSCSNKTGLPAPTIFNGFLKIGPNNPVSWPHTYTMFFAGDITAVADHDFTITTTSGKYVASSSEFTDQTTGIKLYFATFTAPIDLMRVTSDVTLVSEKDSDILFYHDPYNLHKDL